MVQVYGDEPNQEIMMESNLTNKESLKIITDMITLAKGNAKQSFFHIILWGWVIIAISLIQFYMIKFTNIEHSELIWMLTFPAGIVSAIYGYKEGKKEKSSSFIDTIYMWTWFTFILTLITVLIISSRHLESIPLYILAIAGSATFLSGKILQFSALVWGGIAFWLWCIVAFILQNEYVLLFNAATIFTGYIIPGYMLKNKLKKNGV